MHRGYSIPAIVSFPAAAAAPSSSLSFSQLLPSLHRHYFKDSEHAFLRPRSLGRESG